MTVMDIYAFQMPYAYFLGFVVSSTTMISHLTRSIIAASLSCLFIPSFPHNLQPHPLSLSTYTITMLDCFEPLEIIVAPHRPEKYLVYGPLRIRGITRELSMHGAKKTL
jgi:hypothetical protein